MTFSVEAFSKEWAKVAAAPAVVEIRISSSQISLRMHTPSLPPTDLRGVSLAAEWMVKNSRNLLTGFIGTLARHAHWSASDIGHLSPEDLKFIDEPMILMQSGKVACHAAGVARLSEAKGKNGPLDFQPDLKTFSEHAKKVAAEAFKGLIVKVH